MLSIKIPDDIISQMGWKKGDRINIEIIKCGATILLTKLQKAEDEASNA